MSNDISASLPTGTTLMLLVNSTTDNQELRAYLRNEPSIKKTGFLVEIVLSEDLRLNLETGNLQKCICQIPALNTNGDSVNHASTLISESFEVHRKSHTKNPFRDVYFEDSDGCWKLLNTWRNRAGLPSENIKNITSRLNQTVNQPDEFYKILDLINFSRNVAQFIADLGLDKSNNEDERSFKMQKILDTLVRIDKLKQVLDSWQVNQENSSEAFWQELLEKNSLILSQVFSIPVVILCSQAYVGGKGINNTGGSLLDFILVNKLTRNTILIEIKTPVTKILQGQYRKGVYTVSSELSGAVSQVLNSRNLLLKDYHKLVNESEEHFEVFNPTCMVLVGHGTKELSNQKQRSAFEGYRSMLKDIQIVTYDEIFAKIQILVDLLENKN